MAYPSVTRNTTERGTPADLNLALRGVAMKPRRTDDLAICCEDEERSSGLGRLAKEPPEHVAEVAV
jgi:hypothetical protein